MEKNTLCDSWGLSLADWAIPDSILSQAPISPWQLSPERFGPTQARTASPTVIKIKELLDLAVKPADRSIMDVGCGAGGISLLLLDHVNSITAVDISEKMLDAYRASFEAARKSDVAIRLVPGSWLSVYDDAGTAGVVVCANVLYNVPTPCEFISKLDEAATLGVVLEIHERHPHSVANGAWKHFWGLERPSEPTGKQLLEIVESLGISAHSSTFYRNPERRREVDDDLVQAIRERVCLDPSRDDEVRAFLLDNPAEQIESRLIWWVK